MLNSLRTASQTIVAKILLSLLVLSFAAWGIGDIFRTSGDDFAVKVGEQKVSPADFDKIVARNLQEATTNFGAEFAATLKPKLAASTAENITSRLGVLNIADEAGFVISDELVAEEIVKFPGLTDSDGKFSSERLGAMLRQNGMTEEDFVRSLKEDMQIKLIEEHLLQSSYVPPALLKTLVEVENEKRKVDIYKIESRTVSQVPEPTDTELQQYYQDHKDNFNAPEFREVSYALIGLENIEKIEVSEEEVEAELKQNESTQQAKVDSKQPQRIFKQFASDTKEEAQAVLKSLKEDGAEWGVQTASTTLDAVQARTGKMRAEDFEPEVAKSLFALEVGEISEVIETPLGFQIFQLDEIIKPVSDAQSASVEQDKKEQEKVRNEIRKSITQAKQEEALYAMIEKIEDELAGRVELAEITGKYGLKLEKTGRINYQGISADGSQASVPQYTQFLSRAFEIEEKAPPAMFEMAPNVFAIIRLDSLEKERSRALDEVRGFVSTAWQEYKRGEMVKEKAEGLAASVADITKATDHQPSSRNVVLSRDGSGYHDVLPPSLIEEIFSLAVGKVSRAHLRVNGDYFVAKVTAIGESRTLSAEVMEKSVKRITEELKAESSSIKLSEFISSLNKRYGVSINQAVLDAYQAKDE